MTDETIQLNEESYRRLESGYNLTREELDNIPMSKLASALRKLDLGDRPSERVRQQLVVLNGRDGTILENGYERAFTQVRQMRASALRKRFAGLPTRAEGSVDIPILPGTAGLNPDNSGWTALGPGNVGGRTRAIVIDPGNTQRIFTATAGGGVWRTTDGGTTWIPTDDLMGNLATCSLVMDPTDSNTLFAGTGEGYSNVDAIRGDGIFVTADGGVTWNALAATTSNPDFHFVNALAMSANGQTLLAGTTTGIFRSTNAGQNWTQVSNQAIGNLVCHATDSNRAIAGSLRNGSAFYTTDGGVTWSTATPGAAGGRRVQVCYAAADANITYASVDAANSQIWRSTDGGQTYTLRIQHSFLGGQGWYNNAIWAGDPTDTNLVVVGGIDLWRSTDGGSTLTQISQWWNDVNAHADHHAIVSDPGYNGSTNRRVYFGHDGGLDRVDNIETVTTLNGWIDLNNGYAVTQFYYAAGHIGTNTILGGTQDNGTLRYTPSQGVNGWNETYGGDGGACASDPTDSQIWYGEYTFMEIFRDESGGLSAPTPTSGITGHVFTGGGWQWKPEPFTVPEVRDQEAMFIAPFEIDPNESNRILGGALSLWRTNDARTPNTSTTGPSWRSIKNRIGNDRRTHAISAIGIAETNSDVVYVGHVNGNMYRSSNATDNTPNWTRIDTNGIVPNRACLCLTVDPNDADLVYAGFAGFESDNLWVSQNGGQIWSDLSGNLPDAPVHAIAIHPQRPSWLYAATLVGIFASEDGGQNWSVNNEGPTNAAVFDLIWMRCNLVGVTHGRGMFEIDLTIANALPVPQLSFIGTEDYSTAAGDFTRYRFEVTNRADYMVSLFRASPDLPPCGLNTNSSRTWVDIYDADTDQRINRFCALGSPDNLSQLWFAEPRGDAPPSAIYIVMRDRRCEVTSQSGLLAIPGTQINPVAFTNPAPGSTLIGNTVTVEWNPGDINVSQWWLYVGTTVGGREHYDSGSLGTSLFETVTGLPTDGSTVHMRLWHRESGVWRFTDAQYTASLPTEPSLQSPTPGTTLQQIETFEWSANGTTVSQWWLYVGSSVGGQDIFNSGSLGTSLFVTVTGLPTDGRTIHVRLWYRSAGRWLWVDTQYTAMQAGVPAIRSHAAGATLMGQNVTFEWSSNGETVSQYWLYVGTSEGSRDIFDSGSLGTQVSHTVSGLPADGSQIHVRLWYRVAGVWRWSDHVFMSA